MPKSKPTTIVSLWELDSVKRSVGNRLARLRSRCRGWVADNESPIQAIGVFQDEIDSMESTLQSMDKRLRDAKITIEI